MKSIIICEGKTDLILYSYYLSKVSGWQSLKKKENRKLKDAIENRLSQMTIENDNQMCEWYYRGDDILCIYAVGSYSGISNGLSQITSFLYDSSDEKFDKVAVVSDRDDEGVEKELLKTISKTFSEKAISFIKLTHNTWNSSDEFEIEGKNHKISVLPLVIPFNETGTIETFLLNCRREINEGEGNLVDSANDYINELVKDEYVRNNYLSSRGIIPKSKLGAYFSVVSPNKTFEKDNEILASIPWERYSTFHQTLHLLSEI
jgi:hypothetical protein